MCSQISSGLLRAERRVLTAHPQLPIPDWSLVRVREGVPIARVAWAKENGWAALNVESGETLPRAHPWGQEVCWTEAEPRCRLRRSGWETGHCSGSPFSVQANCPRGRAVPGWVAGLGVG